MRVAAALVAVVLAACSGSDGDGTRGAGREAARAGRDGSVPAEPVAVTPYVAEEFLRSGVHTQDDGARYAVRWPAGDDVRVEVAGNPTPDDLAVLDASIAAFGAIVPVPVRRVASDGNVVVHFDPRSRWPEIVDDPDVDLGAAGWTYTYSESSDARDDVAGELRDATIVVDSETSQAARNRVIAHELGHALGLGHSTCPSSLMFDGDLARPLWSPTPLDREMLRVLYSDAVEPGMTPSEVDAVLDPSSTVGPVCGVVDWQLVHHAGRSYFCVAGPGAQPCVAYEGPVEPIRPVDAPDGWVSGGLFADYDPARWEAFRFGDARLLCERSAAQYRPCATFDGVTQPSYPVQTPSYWTDGTYVYDDFPG